MKISHECTIISAVIVKHLILLWNLEHNEVGHDTIIPVLIDVKARATCFDHVQGGFEGGGGLLSSVFYTELIHKLTLARLV